MKKLFTILLIFVNLSVYAQSDSALIVRHLTKITKTDSYRNYQNVALLDKTADYIFSTFRQYADTAYFQLFTVNGATYKNVICRLNTASHNPLVVVGAHYDVCGNQQGADDNASGVVGLLELVRMLANEKLNYPVEFVAFTLEEPPFFRTEFMGSYIHAKHLNNNKTAVYGMVALEMIGYFSERKKSQSYPIKAMKVAYGTTGNFILLTKKVGAGDFVKRFSMEFTENATINTESIKAPAKIQGIDFSDHLNYWKFGYDALMVTNTAFYRNRNYHFSSDTMETLDIGKMQKVINTTFEAIKKL